MPQKPNTALRIVVPILLALAGVGGAVAVMVNTNTGREVTQSRVAESRANRAADEARLEQALSDEAPGREAEAASETEQPAAEQPGPDQTNSVELSQSDQPIATENPSEQQAGPTEGDAELTAAPTRGLRARLAENIQPESLGLLESAEDASTVPTARIEFSQIGAGIRSLKLAGEYVNVQDRTDARLGAEVPDESHVELQATARLTTSSGAQQLLVPFAALWVDIDGERVSLATSPDGRNMIWTQQEAGAFSAIIEDAEGNPVLRIERTFRLDPGSYDISLTQQLFNLTDEPISARLVQTGPIDLAADRITYGGDKRRYRIGHLFSASADPTRQLIETITLQRRPKSIFIGPSVLGSRTDGVYQPAETIWPNVQSEKKELELAWIGTTSRYFGVAVHRAVDLESPSPDLRLNSVGLIERLMLDPREEMQPVALRLSSPRTQIAPGETADLSYRIYAGPLSNAVIDDNPEAAAAGVGEMVVFNFGGPCAICTFGWMTDLLIITLRGLHSIFQDYALAVMGLVLVVRGVLHPLNRWSQIRVQRFGKQMADMAPEMKKIQEKYKDDPKRVQEETARVWREKGVNPAGLLGCLPMLLQTPVWIALYASLFFFYEMRHEPAFFGVFQTLTSGGWGFLEDLASPDALIPLPASFHFSIPWMGSIESFNILPILLAVVFYAHQKFLTPPTAATMTPEQEAQQKMIKVMMVVMMPVFMYNAPSGLALYFITNSSLAILENSWIRAHIKKHDLLETPTKSAKPRKPKKSGGFFERLEKLAEEQKKTYNERMRQQQKAAGYRSGQKKESAADRIRRKQQGK